MLHCISSFLEIYISLLNALRSPVYYLLLRNKLSQNLAAWNNYHLLSHSFCAQECGSSLAGWFWFRVSWGCNQAVGQGCSHLRLNWAWRTHFQACSRGCWLEASVPHHVGLSIGLLMTWLAREQLIQKRETKCEAAVFSNLISEASFHHSVMFYWSHKPFLLRGVCVLAAGVCGGQGEVLLHKSVNARRNHGHHIFQELHYFYFISQSSMPVDSFPPL